MRVIRGLSARVIASTALAEVSVKIVLACLWGGITTTLASFVAPLASAQVAETFLTASDASAATDESASEPIAPPDQTTAQGTLAPEAAPPGDVSGNTAADITASNEELLLPENLEAAGAIIGEIIVVNGDVFDPDLPEENNWLFRLANKLHIETRPDVVRNQLLFKTGEKFSARLLRESERILRSRQYLFDAKITPARYLGGKVDIVVRTRDVWTLKPGIEFSRSGGANESGFSFEESNLLGLGKEIELSYTKDVDRNSSLIRYFDPQVMGSWNRLGVAYSDNSDGNLQQLSVDRPFYSLETPWSAGVGMTHWDRIDSRYNLGEAVDEFQHNEELAEIFGGWSKRLSNNWIRRTTFGVGYQRNRFSATDDPTSAAVLPENRTLAYPYVDVHFLEDAFEERRNQDQIERTEDFYIGTYLRGRVGYAAESLGSDRDAVLLSLLAGTSFEPGTGNKHTLQLTGESETRLEDGDLQNAVLTAATRYYWAVTARQLFYAAISGTISENLDAEKQILLGGDNGLRGYPLRYQDGSARALVTLEYRVFTKWYLFRLFNVGGAAFFDAGRTWGQGNAGTSTEGLLKDVGLGLRLGSSRSSFGNVIHLDVAFPLDGDDTIDSMQFLVTTKRSF